MPALRVVSPQELGDKERADAAAKVALEDAAAQPNWQTDLAAHIQNEFSRFQRHRGSGAGWSDRLDNAMRMFKGEYDANQLAAIKQFGGSEVYARLVAVKCRGASALLRDVYLNSEKPWGLDPTPDPTLPDDVMQQIQQLVQVEVQTMTKLGQPPDPGQIRDRVQGLFHSAKHAALRKARTEADAATDKLDDILVEGMFYQALADFLVDLPLFPFACIKGPVVRVTPSVTWKDGKAVLEDKPKLFWYRVSPYDVWWTPGVSRVADAAVIELQRLTRADLNQLLGLPGYNEAQLRLALSEYGRSGFNAMQTDGASQTRADMESRESPSMNESGIIDMLEYHGYIQGSLLQDYGMNTEEIPDPERDYFVDAYLVGRYVIKCQISASVRKRPPYYMTSFEKVPGTVVGNALPDILADMQNVCNASLRSLVNNMSIASGPQVVLNASRLAPNEDGSDIHPWKRWFVSDDPMGNSASKPIEFFQPASNAQENLGVYKEMQNIADDISAIPKYVTGSDRLGGAGRTASGLAMLMGNASKILQTVAANVDNDVIAPSISELYDMIMLTDTTGMLRGDESIKVLGVTVAVQRETQRQRQLEFLQTTANPFDMQIMGVQGRANVLRAVSTGLGLPGTDVVPPDDEIAAKMAQPPQGPQGQPGQPGAPGGVANGPAPPGAPAPDASQEPQTNLMQ